MALCEITACKYETRDGRGFAVATAANGSRWEYELFEGGDGKEFCNGVLEPIREVWIHDEAFAASRLSMMRIMARRMNAATVVA